MNSTQSDEELFRSDLENGWNRVPKEESGWLTTEEHSNELYDLYGVGDVKNVLCLRLFSSSLYEIACSGKGSHLLMNTIFGERLIRNLAESDVRIYETIEQTTQHLAWRIRKSQILVFRRESANHGWKSVRDILVKIFSRKGEEDERVIAGMFSTILKDVFHNKNLRDEMPLLPKRRFKELFGAAFVLFNDTIGEYIRDEKKEVVHEMLAARLVYFYTRLAADTWRILVIRNGPKVETEWYMLQNSMFDDSTTSQNSRKSSIENSSFQKNKNNNNNSSFFYEKPAHLTPFGAPPQNALQ